MTQPLQTQYACLNDRRLHYGRLFWQNIAFHLGGLLAVAGLLVAARPVAMVVGCVVGAAGAGTVLMAFIAWRLMRLEGVYERHLRAIEDRWIADGEAGIQRPDLSGRGGSRMAVVMALVIGGVGLAVAGLAWR